MTVKSICSILLNPSRDNSSTPLHESVLFGHCEIARYILSVVDNENVNPRNSNGFTPLHWAACGGHLDIHILIAERLDDKNPSTNDGHKPIHFGVQYEKYDICKFIIDNGGDPNPKLNDGTSALDLAVLAVQARFNLATSERIRDLIFKNPKKIKLQMSNM